MRNKDLCLKCKYHSFFGPTPERVRKGEPLTKIEKERVMCYYAQLSGNGTALKRNGKGVIDTRGYDPNHCNLFEEGVPKELKRFIGTIEGR